MGRQSLPASKLLSLLARQHPLVQIIDHRFAHFTKVVRRPSITLPILLHGRIQGQVLGAVKQIGGVLHGVLDRDIWIDPEQLLITRAAGRKGNDTEGLDRWMVAHWTPPEVVEVERASMRDNEKIQTSMA